MNIVEKNIDELTPYENNPRFNDSAVPFVMNSIKEFGFKVPIVIDRDNIIVAGHTRLKAAKALGLSTVPCIVADDLTPEQIKAFRLADNKTGEIADWDMDALMVELDNIADFDMGDFGFDLSDFSVDKEEPPKETKAEEDNFDVDDALNNPPMTKTGDLWLMGNHKLLCGDATSPVDVDVLLDEENIHLYITDPPYNVSLGKSGSCAGKRKEYQGDDGAIANDNLPDKDFFRLLVNAFSNAKKHMIPGAAFYVWYSDSENLNFRNACVDVGWQIRQTLIWNKNSLVLGRQDYQWKHEPCLYGWTNGKHRWFSDRTQATVIDMDKPTKSAEHPTMKPIGLFSRQIINSSQAGEVVYDSFAGSGTTLIACEQLGRKARLMELMPRYCDVIVERFVKFKGKSDKVFLVRNGERLTYDDVKRRL